MYSSQVIKRLNELREEWREQNFTFTPEQYVEFNKLKDQRRERVKYFYENDLVSKGGPKKEDTK